MKNLDLENKCTICEKMFDVLYENQKYCLEHCPDDNIKTTIKRECHYCQNEKSKFICDECKAHSHKKEWAVVQHLRKNVDYKFQYDSNKILQGCALNRPDVFYDCPEHVVIVEIDENQHKFYEDLCECARLNNIDNGIGGRPVIIIRFNPDSIKHKGKKVQIKLADKYKILVDVVNKELQASYEQFTVKLIQLYFDDNFTEYQVIKETDITDLVAV